MLCLYKHSKQTLKILFQIIFIIKINCTTTKITHTYKQTNTYALINTKENSTQYQKISENIINK